MNIIVVVADGQNHNFEAVLIIILKRTTRQYNSNERLSFRLDFLRLPINFRPHNKNVQKKIHYGD